MDVTDIAFTSLTNNNVTFFSAANQNFIYKWYPNIFDNRSGGIYASMQVR